MDQPILRLAVCTAAVLAVTAALYAVPLERRPLSSTLAYLFVVLVVSAVWGFRYSLFLSFLATLGFSWLLPPIGHFWLRDSRDVLVLSAFLVIGITTSRLSDRARREAVNANLRSAEAVAAQRRFADLVNSVDGIVWVADAGTLAFSFVSEQAERILGYPAKQWLREPTFWEDHLHSEDRGWAKQLRQQATTEKRNLDFEHRMIAADGRVVWLRNLVTVEAENGSATQLRGVMVDTTQRRQNEETLREQANLLSLTHDAVFVHDTSAIIKYWNRAAEEMYGWTAEEASGNVAHHLLKTAFPAPREQIVAQLLLTGRWEGELVHTRKDGTRIVVASRWSLQQNEKGAPLAVLEINNDITEQRRAEQAREELEEQWKAAFESNPTMYFIVDVAGNIASVNPFGAEQLGYTVGELVGQPVLDIFYEPDRMPVQKHAAECFEQPGRTMKWEARKIRKDGTLLWVRETANSVVLRERLVLLVACENVTEQKRAEEALRRSEAYLAEAQRLTHTGSWAYDPAAERAIYWSEEMCRIFGLDPKGSSLPNRKLFQQLMHPEDRDKFNERVETAYLEKADFEQDYRIVLPDGTVKHLHEIGHPVLDEAGNILEYLGTEVDVTELKRAEEGREKLRQIEADLARINRVSMMGELTASLGHEIKQPIAAAVSNAEACLQWLARDKPDLAEVREAATEMVKEARRAAEIITRIRSLFKKDETKREVLHVNEVIGETVSLIREEAGRRSISVRTELDAELPKISADRVQLQQVLINLMLNGLEAMKGAEGDLIIRSKHDENGRVLISVSDSGVGLPVGGSDKIFDAFFTTKPQGTGMGLAISRSIIESHGGRLWATANSGPGSTFYFNLPIEVAEKA
jgi:PAS domain S-box-containing protein